VLIFLGALCSTAFTEIKRVDVITNDECVRDYTFVWTAPLNDFLA
jgi:hypothetical protein